MIVEARRFARLAGGRYSGGEFLLRRLTLPDAQLPVAPEEAIERSVKAAQHFWPDLTSPTPASYAVRKHLGWWITSPGWSVVWKLPGFDEHEQAFIQSLSGANADTAVSLWEQHSKNETVHHATKQGVSA